MRFADGTLVLTPVAKNAVRIQYAKEHKYQLPEEWLYPDLKEQKASAMQVKVSTKTEQVFIYDENDCLVTTISKHDLAPTTVQGKEAYRASIVIDSPDDEYITGL